MADLSSLCKAILKVLKDIPPLRNFLFKISRASYHCDNVAFYTNIQNLRGLNQSINPTIFRWPKYRNYCYVQQTVQLMSSK